METYLKAAEIKVKGDEMLKMATDAKLGERRLSIVDPTVIALAKKSAYSYERYGLNLRS